MKTLEYRLFRKMREKLRNFYKPKTKNKNDKVDFNKNPDSIIKKFASEAKGLVEGN